jgi:hypothetical protein
MANYLTEHHTSQLRAHMQRVAAAYGSAAPSPVPGAEPGSPFPGATEPMRRMPSGAGRAPSALSVRRDMASPTTGIEEEPRAAGGLGITLKGALVSRPGSSRTSSTATPVPGQPGSRPGTAVRLSNLPNRRFPRFATPLQQQQHPPTPTGPQQEGDETEIAPPSPAASTATSSSSSSDSPVQSRIIRRPPRFQPSKDTRGGTGPYGAGDPDDADDDDEPAFLPFARPGNPAIAHHVMPSASTTSSEGSGQDLGETLRGGFPGGPVIGRRPVGMTSAAAAGAGASALPTIDGVQSQSQTSDSSIGSTAVVRRPVMTAVVGAGGNPGGDNSRRTPLSANTAAAAGQGVGGPLSPRRMAELAGRGSRHRSMLKEESDGTPSMGSSFSDLDGEYFLHFLVLGRFPHVFTSSPLTTTFMCPTCPTPRQKLIRTLQTPPSHSQRLKRPWPVACRTVPSAAA